MRGEIYRFNRPRDARGHEQQGRRFAIVVQAQRLTALSTWLIVPTSASAQSAIFRPEVEIARHGTSHALCDALVSIDPSMRLGDHVGTVSYNELQAIDDALRMVLDL